MAVAHAYCVCSIPGFEKVILGWDRTLKEIGGSVVVRAGDAGQGPVATAEEGGPGPLPRGQRQRPRAQHCRAPDLSLERLRREGIERREICVWLERDNDVVVPAKEVATTLEVEIWRSFWYACTPGCRA
eukprot:scaffold2.g7131.t1